MITTDVLGIHRVAATSGVLTLVPGGTATTGHVFVFRAPVTNLAVVTRVAVKHWVVTPATAQLSFMFNMLLLSGFSGAYSGGSDQMPTGRGGKKKSSHVDPTVRQIRIGGAGALTAGTQVLSSTSFLAGGYTDGAAAEAGVGTNNWSMTWDKSMGDDYGLVLTGDEGFIIRNEILGTAAGTARMVVEVDWYEVAP